MQMCPKMGMGCLVGVLGWVLKYPMNVDSTVGNDLYIFWYIQNIYCIFYIYSGIT